jgi:hypothetical protein
MTLSSSPRSSSPRRFLPSVAWRLVDDAARRKVFAPRRAVCRRLAPAIRSDRATSLFDAGERAEPGDELPIGQRWRRFAGNVAMETVALVALGELPRQAFVDGPRTEDQQVVARWQPVRDVCDESVQVFEAVGLAGRLRAAPAAVTDGGIVPDVAGRPVVSRHLRFHSFDSRPVALQADDEGLPRVDPYKRAASSLVRFRPVQAMCRRHERAQAGPASASSARSA